METLEIAKNTENGILTLTLTGRLSIVTSPQLSTEIDGIGSDIQTLRIVMAKIEYVSSAGLRVLVAAQKKMSAAGGVLEITSPTSETLELFEMTGLKDIFTIK